MIARTRGEQEPCLIANPWVILGGGVFQRKLALATEAVRLGLPLTINAVVHRGNIERIREMVDLAIKLKAKRIEIAHVQYYGWAVKNRAALMPTREQVDRAMAELEEVRQAQHGH